jgi:hypothetical protein
VTAVFGRGLVAPRARDPAYHAGPVRPPSSPWFAALVALAAIGAPACGDPIQVPTDDDTTTASGLGAGTPVSSSDGSGGGTGSGGAGGMEGEGGSAPIVWVGLVANPLDADPDASADDVEAAVSTFAIGASVFATKRTWASTDADGFALDAKLAGAGCSSTAACRPTALTIAVVDGLRDGRPPDLADEPWASDASKDALDASIDAAMEALGPSLAFLAIGARVDRWVAEHDEDAEELQDLLAHAIDRALDHPDARDDLLVGVGLSRQGALADGGQARTLRELGNATMASLFPGLHDLAAGTEVPSPGSIALDLDALDDVDPGRPVALVEVGYPSSELVGGSDEAQGLFLDSLFEALGSRRASFPLVVVSRLHDLGGDACNGEGIELGEEEELVLAYRCSTGARDEDGEPKAAWWSFVVGAAQLASGAAPRDP